MEKFGQYVNEAGFKGRMEQPIRNPKGAVANEILDNFNDTIKLLGKNVPYSPMERSAAVSSFYSYVQYHGVPSVFFTIAPDDTH
jgi:hypothetical protein